MTRGYIFFVLFLTLLTGCKKIDKLTQFEMDYTATIVIPSSTVINLPFNLLTPDIESDSESEFAVNNTHKDKVEEIILKSLNLSISSPSHADFSFLESINIYIVAEGLSEEIISWKTDIPEDIGSMLSLETADTDLKEYIKKDEFSLRLNTVTDELITSDYQIKLEAIFFVDAKILGQ